MDKSDEFSILALETIAAIEATAADDLERRDRILRGSQFPPSQHAHAAMQIAAMVIGVFPDPEAQLDSLRRWFVDRPWEG